MKKLCLCIVVAISLTACSHTYYVVRHAEKQAPGANMTSDVQLSEAGRQRAISLKDELMDKNIRSIYSTNTIRTKSTAEPLAEQLQVEMEIYGPMPDAAFINLLKSFTSNTLIVGHSNTVDDIVNGLTNRQSIPGDLSESAYDNLFIVRYNRFFGTKITMQQKKYGRLD